MQEDQQAKVELLSEKWTDWGRWERAQQTVEGLKIYMCVEARL